MLEISAYDEWKSLFTDEAKRIWQQEPKELRRVSMVLYIMRQEFNRIEDDYKCRIKKLEEEYTLNSTKSESDLLSQESPKINRHKRFKHLLNSPSLLKAPKETNISTNESKQIESFVLDSSSSENEDFIGTHLKPTNLFKSPRPSKTDEDNDVLVDCSIIVAETPIIDKPVKDVSKWIQTRNKKKLKQVAITKLLLGGSKKRKPSDRSLSKQNVSDIDQTYFTPIEDKKSISPAQLNVNNDYDVIPVTKSYSPQHVHKTEVVRKKSERLKLPGWSCTNCEKFYECLDLSPTKLKQKMDACSRHRNKFPPLNETPRGFWDITMPPTQDAYQQ